MHFTHCMISVRIRSFSGPYSVRMRENANQKNSEYGHFSRSGHHSTSLWKEIQFSEMYSEPWQPLIVSIPVWTSTAKVNTSEEAIILIVLLLFLNTYLTNVIHGCIYSMTLCIVWSLFASYTIFFLSLLLFLFQCTIDYFSNRSSCGTV